jgi:glycosyltransferase involved in cell wall biosynthesis
VIRVGWARRNYGVERVVYGAVHPELEFRRVAHLPLTRVTKDPFWRHATVALAGRGVDLIHLYGDVALVNRPWVMSFEDAVPAGRPGTARRRAGVRALSAARCRALVAISEHARRRLAADPEAHALLEKCETSWPCVPSEDDLFERHEALLARPAGDAPVECLFVGNLFFLKGGEFVLDALEPLAARGDPGVRLTVVSTLEADSYVSRVDEARRKAARERLKAPWIRWEERLSPRAVRERMAESHLLLFPTLNETFGFVLAEAMATGLDAVTVASRAIPEILPPSLLPEAVRVPLNEAEEWAGTRLWRTAGDGAWRAAWEEAREQVVEAIRARVRAAASDPADLRRKARILRSRHEERFSPERLGERLLSIYEKRL